MQSLPCRRSAAHCAQRGRGGPLSRAWPPIHGAVPQLGGEFSCAHCSHIPPSAQLSTWQCHALPLKCSSTCLSRYCPQTCSMLWSAEPVAIECRILPSTTMMELMQCSGMILCPAHKAIMPESHKPVASIYLYDVARTAVRMCVLPQLCDLQASPLRTKQPLHSASVSWHGSTSCITTHRSGSALPQM